MALEAHFGKNKNNTSGKKLVKFIIQFTEYLKSTINFRRTLNAIQKLLQILRS